MAPKGLALSPDGKRLYVANRTGDTISIVDTATREVCATLSLDAPAELTRSAAASGSSSAPVSDSRDTSAAPTATSRPPSTACQWDLEPDGFGKDIVDNRLLEDVGDTAPFKWNGGNPNLETECGPRTEKFFYRSQSYDGLTNWPTW